MVEIVSLLTNLPKDNKMLVKNISMVHQCCLKYPLTFGQKEDTVENRLMLEQGVAILSGICSSFLFENGNMIEKTMALLRIISQIPQTLFQNLPPMLLSFFQHFPKMQKSSTKSSASFFVQDPNFDGTLWNCCPNSYNEWLPKFTRNFASFLPQISNTCTVLLRNEYVLGPSCLGHVEICELLLPHFILVMANNRKQLPASVWDFVFEKFNSLLKSAIDSKHHSILGLILKMVHVLRQKEVEQLRRANPCPVPRANVTGGRFCPSDSSNIVATLNPFENLLRFDWHLLAKAADIANIGDPCAVLLYSQLHFETKLKVNSKNEVILENGGSMTSASKDELSQEIEMLMLMARNAALISLNDGGGSEFLAGLVSVADWVQSEEIRFLYYSITAQYGKALGIANDVSRDEIMEIRFNNGDILMSDVEEDYQYEHLWRLCDWKQLPKCLPNGGVEFDSKVNPDKAIYSVLNILNDDQSKFIGSQNAISKICKNSIEQSLEKQMHFSTKSTKHLEKFKILMKVANYEDVPIVGGYSDQCESDLYLNNALKCRGLNEEQESATALADLCFKLIANKKPMLAAKVAKRHKGTCFDKVSTLIGAQMAWDFGERHQAVQILRRFLISDGGGGSGDFLQAKAVTLFAKWNTDHNFNGGNDLETIETLRSFLSKNNQSNNQVSKENLADMHMALARYCEHRYRQLDQYIRSPSFTAKSTIQQKCAAELGEIKENLQQTQQSRIQGSERYVRSLEHVNRIDGSEIDFVLKQRDFFLNDALKSFLMVMRQRDQVEDMVAYRVVGLWLGNDEKPNVIQIVQHEIPSIATAKFVPLFYQIAARYCATSSAACSSLPISKQCLHNLLFRTACDHPYHTLPVLLQLSSSDPSPSTSTGRSGTKRQRLAGGTSPPPSDNLGTST